jgi:inosine-uridine nucleoside N-ribohydrolase
MHGISQSLTPCFRWSMGEISKKTIYIGAGILTLLCLSCLLYRSYLAKRLTDRKIIVITDLEPDDRKAIDILTSVFSEKEILCFGTTVMHAGRKAALVRKVLDQRGLQKVPVYQGTGGRADCYPDIDSTSAARSYTREGCEILSENELNLVNDQAPSSAELQINLRKLLKSADVKSIEIVMLAPPSDLVEVLKASPNLSTKIKRIHIMGGWIEIQAEGSDPLRRTSYNWDMDVDSSSQLMKMSHIPMTLYSSHILKKAFKGGSINSKHFPNLIAKINDCRLHLPFLEDDLIATQSWNTHVMKTIPRLKDVIGNYADHQFTPADPAVVIGMINSNFIMKEKSVKIDIDLADQTKQGTIVHVEKDPSSKISLVKEVNLEIFKQEMLSTYDRFLKRQNSL